MCEEDGEAVIPEDELCEDDWVFDFDDELLLELPVELFDELPDVDDDFVLSEDELLLFDEDALPPRYFSSVVFSISFSSLRDWFSFLSSVFSFFISVSDSLIGEVTVIGLIIKLKDSKKDTANTATVPNIIPITVHTLFALGDIRFFSFII